jgi:outer membrane protein OmpA-like peptidoglycan-associated protein
MPFPYSKCLHISALFLLLNIPIFGKGFSVVPSARDSIVKMSGYVYDTIRTHPDTILVKAKITLESIPHGNEIGIITSNDNGFYEYYVNMSHQYRINVISENHRRHSEVFEPESELSELGIERNFYLEPELKENQVIRLNKLIFKQGEASITSESFQELNRLVGIMNENVGMQIQLEGHTDYRGSKKLNMELSQNRVQAVKSYLIGKGISSKRIKTRAYGGTKPLIKEQSIEASEVNRRVEVRILRL